MVVLLEEYLDKHAPSTPSIPELHIFAQKYFAENRDTVIPDYHSKAKYWKYIKHTFPEKAALATQHLRKIRRDLKELNDQERMYYMDNSSVLFLYCVNKKPQSANSVENGRMRQFYAKTQSTAAIEPSPAVRPSAVQDTYLKNVRNQMTSLTPYIIPYNKCICNVGELIPCEEDGVMICNRCGNMVQYVAGTYSSDNKEQPNEISYSSYTRLVHFREILSQTQGRSTGHISTEVIEKIRDRIQRERIFNVEKLTIVKMRDILRTLELTDNYFDHVQYLRKLMGVHIPSIPEGLQMLYCNMFLEVQKPWNLHKPEERHNFSNCGYLLYQFCVLTDQPQYLSHIHLLQRDKLEEHDEIFEKVCRDLNWKFVPMPK
jgi:hypothetical protein